MEVGIFDDESINHIFRVSDYEDFNKIIIEDQKKKKSKIIKSSKDNEKKYYLHTIKKYSKNSENNLFTSIILIGQKKRFTYVMALYNIDVQKLDYFENLLVNLFESN